MKKVTRKVGKYEVGRTIGEGTFAKVKFAHNTETGESVAMKVMAKSTILKHRMVDQVSNFSSFMNLELFLVVCCIFHFPAYLIGFISGNCIDF
ncbi:CBL-interacting serine/threonine-protein kinase 24 [Vitis vinifera]|uniref:non-specific serine/threonine protein kinase n=1 Tax=Vitis vinifera TaxID=29760 RepID=A0A438C1G7_VITVI|nr:CBL-interacting serine/threonine-protein kinase 24 [Vitis vinifera]